MYQYASTCKYWLPVLIRATIYKLSSVTCTSVQTYDSTVKNINSSDRKEFRQSMCSHSMTVQNIQVHAELVKSMFMLGWLSCTFITFLWCSTSVLNFRWILGCNRPLFFPLVPRLLNWLMYWSCSLSFFSFFLSFLSIFSFCCSLCFSFTRTLPCCVTRVGSSRGSLLG